MKDIKINKSRSKKESAVNITIENECTVNNVEELHKEFVNIIETFETFNIAVKNIVNIDLAGYQLLYSLKKELDEANKNVTFDLQINEDLKSVLDNAGLKKLNT